MDLGQADPRSLQIVLVKAGVHCVNESIIDLSMLQSVLAHPDIIHPLGKRLELISAEHAVPTRAIRLLEGTAHRLSETGLDTRLTLHPLLESTFSILLGLGEVGLPCHSIVVKGLEQGPCASLLLADFRLLQAAVWTDT